MFENLLPKDIFNNTFLADNLWGNKIGDYLVFILLFLVLVVAVKLLRKGLLAISQKFANKAKSDLPNFIIGKLKKLLVPLEYYGAFYFSIQNLNLHNKFEKALDVIGLVIIVYYAVKFAIAVVDYLIEKKLENTSSPSKVQVLRSIIPAINISIWGLGIVFMLSNLGFNISALVAGLGIGGIAVALAAQSLLGDIFSYVSILADKPFEIGDLLNVDGIAGRVTYIGIKTTRLTSVTGEQLVFSNSDLTKSRIRNYQKVDERRAEILIGVVYETPVEKLEMIPQIIKNIIDNVDEVRFERSHFQSYGDFSLNFQTIYWCVGNDYNEFMNKQQFILLEIFKAFKNNNIEFAYPTQKLYFEGNVKNYKSDAIN